MKNHHFIRAIIKQVHAFFSHVYQLFVPPHCFYCKKFDHILSFSLCRECTMHIQPVATIDIPLKRNTFMPVFAAATYEYPIKILILAKQYQQIFACKAIAQLIWEKTDIRFQEFDLIIPIPLHWQRYAMRGYNQAEEIAQVLGQKMQVPVIPLLKRIHATAFQLTLSKKDRAANVANVFTLIKNENVQFYKNKRILLVDDLLTTGSTIASAGNCLLELNPACIKAVVGARVL